MISGVSWKRNPAFFLPENDRIPARWTTSEDFLDFDGYGLQVPFLGVLVGGENVASVIEGAVFHWISVWPSLHRGAAKATPKSNEIPPPQSRRPHFPRLLKHQEKEPASHTHQNQGSPLTSSTSPEFYRFRAKKKRGFASTKPRLSFKLLT